MIARTRRRRIAGSDAKRAKTLAHAPLTIPSWSRRRTAAAGWTERTKKPKGMHPDDRPKATLRAIVAFAKQRDRWPDLDEIHAFRKKIGSRAEVYRQLASLRERGLIELRGHRQASRWVITPAGFDVIGSPPIRTTFEKERAFVDVALIHISAFRQPTPIVLTGPLPLHAASLEIAD